MLAIAAFAFMSPSSTLHAENDLRCGNKKVLDQLESDAVDSLDFVQRRAPPNAAHESPYFDRSDDYEIKMTQYYQTGQPSPDVVTCRGLLSINFAKVGEIHAEMSYQVIETEDGHTVYRLDEPLTSFIDKMMTEAMAQQLMRAFMPHQ